MGSIRRFVLFLKVLYIFLHAVIPPAVVSFVDAVNLPLFWDADVLVGKKELADAWIKCESVNAISCCVDKHRRRAVDAVSGSDLLVPRLKTIPHRPLAAWRDAAIDRKNCTNGHVCINVGGTIERIVQQHV